MSAVPVQPDSGTLVARAKDGLNVGPLPASQKERDQLDEAHDALDALAARLAEAEAQRDEARDFAGDKQTSLVRQWREQAEAAERQVAALEAAPRDLRERAGREPLDTDISDYSDEFCVGFLAGQVNALDSLAAQDSGGDAPAEDSQATEGTE